VALRCVLLLQHGFSTGELGVWWQQQAAGVHWSRLHACGVHLSNDSLRLSHPTGGRTCALGARGRAAPPHQGRAEGRQWGHAGQFERPARCVCGSPAAHCRGALGTDAGVRQASTPFVQGQAGTDHLAYNTQHWKCDTQARASAIPRAWRHR